MSAPVITKQPVAQSVTPGSNVVFAVRADNAVSYQWKRDNVNVSGGQYSGETTNTLTLTAAEAADAGLFKCAVTNGDGTTTSSEVNLAVYSPTFDPAPSDSEPEVPAATSKYAGSGSPEGVVTARQGQTYWRTDNNSLYVKDSAGWTNTGWVLQGGGGGGADPNQSGSGSPVGSATPDYVGQFYFDTDTPSAVWVANGLTNADWLEVAGNLS